MTHAELSRVYEAQGRKCALSGIPIGFSLHTGGRNTASLDRIDPTRDYVPDNIQWVHRDVNLMKLDFTVDEFVSMCRRVAVHTKAEVAVLPREVLRRGPKGGAL